ncbi:MAG TPA: hypothetical protein PKC21_02940 [Oligoflexia bacterium]|nr:hypothetical protein [Oligoflexia bacterium]
MTLYTLLCFAQHQEALIERNIFQDYKSNREWRSDVNQLKKLFSFLKDDPERRSELSFEKVLDTQWQYIGTVQEVPDKPSGSLDHLKIYIETSPIFSQHLTFTSQQSRSLDLYLYNDWSPHKIKIENISFSPIQWINYREEVDNFLFGLLGNSDGIDATYSTISGTSFFVDDQESFKDLFDLEKEENTLNYNSTFFVHREDNQFYRIQPKVGACFLAMEDTYLVCNTFINIPQINRYSSNPIQSRRNRYQYNSLNPLDGFYIFKYMVYKRVSEPNEALVENN